MKRTITFIAAMLLSSAAFCQTRDSIDVTMFTVGYDYKVHTTDKDGNTVTDSLRTVLLVGHKVTKTMGYYTDWVDRLGETRDEYYLKQREMMAHVPTVFVRQEDKKMEVQEDVPVHHYTYTEPAKLGWTLTEDTLTISDYPCHKAQATYGGRTWTAWYTEDIPTTAGPWKLCGLPGLIVKAEDTDSIFSFQLFELTQVQRAITRQEDPTTIKTKRDKFIQMRNKLFLDPRYMKNPLYYYVRAEGDVDGVDIYRPDAKANGNYVSKEQATHYINGVAVPWEQSANEYKPLELK